MGRLSSNFTVSTSLLQGNRMDFRSKNMILSGFIFLFSALGWSAAFKCYECNSITNSACGDPFDASSSFESSSSACTACVKSKVGDLITRSCSTTTSTDDCQTDNDVAACSCTSNLCNGGSSSRLKVTTVAFISSLPLIIYKFGL
ncbi:uncharacterized protein LOC123542331 [Mercenaria mercenaria]|uniref:uncharacterized protein LOC123542331 n=1 Tax=Mercenaria mercenaria TaxID=6596 RepID=UPI00234F5E5F|nr:uncharacterized protein LOC123542331 [Mercenaria mercenaria]